MMAYNLKEIVANKPGYFSSGHRMCAGCGAPIVARMVMRALHEGDHAVVSNATGCMEVSTCIYPYSSWDCSYIHTAFECAPATCSGVETAYKALKRKGVKQWQMQKDFLPEITDVEHIHILILPEKEFMNHSQPVLNVKQN